MSSEQSTDTIKREDDCGAYDPVLRSLEPGVLVRFNANDPSQASTPELKVGYHDRKEAYIELEASDEIYRVSYCRRTGPEIRRENGGTDMITTIEVVGIDG
ncbi:hypothetical protein [Natrialba asiatica]|uniref:Uncharacterized protein n=1 Tax=Natrialba asiatica (strain ATCC 700177 / DSM 12278 / JCM 9576 / FERM P-10747 / NBRC 102637 / 172P1) TaxID=29540 RepID=M0AEN4_NATA1|nr:hypothetical protein [Natrialba asiatica]ELY97210.1 hypothetical protein C481_20621 [Natrialba asiatica DSM 12278]